MDNIYSINKSRIGYAYQYKYALLKILEFMLKGRLTSARVDFPFEGGGSYKYSLSIDIKLELKNPEEKFIYEIKTGKNFKQNNTKQELKKTLRNFYLFERKLSNKISCTKFIIISPEIKSKILEYWDDLLFIANNRIRNSSGENQKTVQKRVFGNLASDWIKDQKEFVRFVKQINFDIGQSYKYGFDSNKIELSELEDVIKNKIDNFAEKLHIKSSEIEIPSWTIALELLEVLFKCSEKNKEIIDKLFEKLQECFTRRRLLREACYKESDKEKLLGNMKEEIANRLTDITKITCHEELRSRL